MLLWTLLLILAASATLRAGTGGFRAGDRVKVKSERAPIKEGQKVVGWLTRGQRVKILLVQGGFARVPYRAADGTMKTGYVALRHLEPPARSRRPKEEDKAPYDPGDEVIVVSKIARLQRGKKVLGLVPAGTRLTVRKVEGKWIGVYAQIDGKKTWGYMDCTHVDYAPMRDPKEKGE
jgi:hypothetical protein